VGTTGGVHCLHEDTKTLPKAGLIFALQGQGMIKAVGIKSEFSRNNTVYFLHSDSKNTTKASTNREQN
jgi:hypothetical protein